MTDHQPVPVFAAACCPFSGTLLNGYRPARRLLIGRLLIGCLLIGGLVGASNQAAAQTPSVPTVPPVPGSTEPASPLAAESPLTLQPPSRPLPDDLQPYFTVPPQWRDDRGGYRSPLQFDDGTMVQSPQQWQLRRQQWLDRWHQDLGAWPPPVADPQLELLDQQERDGFIQHRIRLQWAPLETTTGYLLVPPGEGPFPAVITVFYEPETAIGLGREHRDWAYQLTRRGFVTLSLGTTEASQAKTYALYHPDLDNAQLQPLSMLAYAASTARRALAQRAEVDARRIGIAGHSFGGKWAMFAACLDDQFAAAAWSDPGIVFQQDRPSINYWEPWYLGYHRRPWRKRGLITADNPAHGLYPRLIAEGRDLHELHVLMAPRPLLVSGGSEDPPERWQPLGHTVAVNRLLGFEHRVGMTNRPEHGPNEQSNEVIYRFFEHFLQP